MSEMLGNIVVSCSGCHASGVPYVTRYVRYRNQHGGKVRVFCHVCGGVTDKTERKGIVTTELKSWFVEVRYPYYKDHEIPF